MFVQCSLKIVVSRFDCTADPGFMLSDGLHGPCHSRHRARLCARFCVKYERSYTAEAHAFPYEHVVDVTRVVVAPSPIGIGFGARCHSSEYRVHALTAHMPAKHLERARAPAERAPESTCSAF